MDFRYKPGSNAECGEPVCCRSTDGAATSKRLHLCEGFVVVHVLSFDSLVLTFKVKQLIYWHCFR